MNWLVFFSVIQVIGGIVLVSGYPAQIIKVIKTKSAKDFSIIWLGSVFCGISLMESYAAYCLSRGVAIAFFITNSLILISIGTLFTLVLYYQRSSGKFQ